MALLGGWLRWPGGAEPPSLISHFHPCYVSISAPASELLHGCYESPHAPPLL